MAQRSATRASSPLSRARARTHRLLALQLPQAAPRGRQLLLRRLALALRGPVVRLQLLVLEQALLALLIRLLHSQNRERGCVGVQQAAGG